MASRDFDELTRHQPRPLIGRGASWHCALAELRFWLGDMLKSDRRREHPVRPDGARPEALPAASGVAATAQVAKRS